jgi:hypothetical protein
MQHFDHHHTPEEAGACLAALRESTRLEVRYSWVWIGAQALVTALLVLVFDAAWQWAAWFAWSYFADQLSRPWFESLRRPIKWPCRRLS